VQANQQGLVLSLQPCCHKPRQPAANILVNSDATA
jgi:hypothetical protein